MINAAHIILYSTNAEADRDFIRDVLGFIGVDAGGGWLIFKLPPAEIAVHPTNGPGRHEFYLMCDDIEKTLANLRAKSVIISHPVSEQGWGLLASIRLPSGADLSIYQPRHPIAYNKNQWADPAGSWSDLPETMLEDLDQMRHSSQPTPPLENL